MSQDPLEAALGGEGNPPEPQGGEGGGNEPAPEGQAAAPTDHPVLQRFGGDVQKALDAYQQLDSAFGRQGNDLGKRIADLESQLAESQQFQGEPPPTDPQTGMPQLDLEQLRAWFDEDPAQATAYLVAQGQQMMLDQIDQRLDSRLKPVEDATGRTAASTLVEGLKKALGSEMVERNAEVLMSLREKDPAFFQGDMPVVFQRMKTAVLAAEMERGGPAPQRSASNGAAAAAGNVAVEGGSGGRNLRDEGVKTEDEQFVEALQTTGIADRDVFGNPKRR